jgi:hypothetical protein
MLETVEFTRETTIAQIITEVTNHCDYDNHIPLFSGLIVCALSLGVERVVLHPTKVNSVGKTILYAVVVDVQRIGVIQGFLMAFVKSFSLSKARIQVRVVTPSVLAIQSRQEGSPSESEFR